MSGTPADACALEDTKLAGWTFLRYGVLGLIFLSRVWKLQSGAQKAEEESDEEGGAPKPHEKTTGLSKPFVDKASKSFKEYPYKAHPNFTTKIQDKNTNFVQRLVLAGCMFVLTEGIGLIIYFSLSAVMDNVAIFFISESGVCATVKAVSLYTMAVVTFLPNVLLGSWLQREMYNEGKWPFKSTQPSSQLYNKIVFVVIMAVITVASFSARVWLVYVGGYATTVDQLMRSHFNLNGRVLLAVIVPPIIDGVQSTALIMTGSHAKPLLTQIIQGQQKMQTEVAEMHKMLVKQQEQLDTIEKIIRMAHNAEAEAVDREDNKPHRFLRKPVDPPNPCMPF